MIFVKEIKPTVLKLPSQSRLAGFSGKLFASRARRIVRPLSLVFRCKLQQSLIVNSHTSHTLRVTKGDQPFLSPLKKNIFNHFYTSYVINTGQHENRRDKHSYFREIYPTRTNIADNVGNASSRYPTSIHRSQHPYNKQSTKDRKTPNLRYPYRNTFNFSNIGFSIIKRIYGSKNSPLTRNITVEKDYNIRFFIDSVEDIRKSYRHTNITLDTEAQNRQRQNRAKIIGRLGKNRHKLWLNIIRSEKNIEQLESFTTSVPSIRYSKRFLMPVNIKSQILSPLEMLKFHRRPAISRLENIRTPLKENVLLETSQLESPHKRQLTYVHKRSKSSSADTDTLKNEPSFFHRESPEMTFHKRKPEQDQPLNSVVHPEVKQAPEHPVLDIKKLSLDVMKELSKIKRIELERRGML